MKGISLIALGVILVIGAAIAAYFASQLGLSISLLAAAGGVGSFIGAACLLRFASRNLKQMQPLTDQQQKDFERKVARLPLKQVAAENWGPYIRKKGDIPEGFVQTIRDLEKSLRNELENNLMQLVRTVTNPHTGQLMEMSEALYASLAPLKVGLSAFKEAERRLRQRLNGGEDLGAEATPDADRLQKFLVEPLEACKPKIAGAF